jgi:hypothetical protein
MNKYSIKELIDSREAYKWGFAVPRICPIDLHDIIFEAYQTITGKTILELLEAEENKDNE